MDPHAPGDPREDTAMGRRGNREGTYRHRPDGRWEARLLYDDPVTGERRRASFYGKTKTAVRAKMREAIDRLDADAPVRDAAVTVADWMRRWCTTTLLVSGRADSTKSLYGTLSRQYVEPAPFGAIRLDRLRTSDVEALVLRLQQATRPGRDGTPVRAVADSTIRSTYTVLRQALDGAVRDGLMARNPAAAMKRPGLSRPEVRRINDAQLADLLAATAGSRYHRALLLIAATGLRAGEALALRWDAVDLDAGSLRVVATVGRVERRLRLTTPKTERSRRTVPLTPDMVSMLRRHRADQLAERLRAANVWEDHGLVFPSAFGRPVDPRNLLRVVEQAAAQVGLEGVGVHTLRHAAAVAMLEAGIHIRAVADILGHSSVAVTGDIYGHTSDATARAAVDVLSARLRIADGSGQS
ncbi:integrase [Mycobacterium phage OBUpride]|uniref:Integrase n=13 Tax=Caudoviricetes TaxID=2731619 RepID=A0A0K2CMS1_9CAUD|nr:integrase [Mycobacterium phage OBUpride]